MNSKCDIIAASKTGSGKTLCYLLPMLNKIFKNIDRDSEYFQKTKIDVLILLPTRELAL